MAPRLIAREDEDVSEAVREILTDEGIVVRTDATCIGFKPHADGVAVDVDCASGEPAAVGSHVLLAVGRRPNTDDLGLDRAGVVVDDRGYIVVDESLATNVPASGRWATATDAGPSPTQPTTTMRSSPPIFSIMKIAG